MNPYEPEELYHRNCYACGDQKPPSELQPGWRREGRITKECEICMDCCDEMELIINGDKTQDEGKSQDEIFGDDCDAGYRMDQARGLK